MKLLRSVFLFLIFIAGSYEGRGEEGSGGHSLGIRVTPRISFETDASQVDLSDWNDKDIFVDPVTGEIQVDEKKLSQTLGQIIRGINFRNANVKAIKREWKKNNAVESGEGTPYVRITKEELPLYDLRIKSRAGIIRFANIGILSGPQAAGSKLNASVTLKLSFVEL